MIHLTPEERAVGQDNYFSAVTAYEAMHRRDFLVRSIAAGGVAAAGLGGMYYGYGSPRRPIRTAIIGVGDEGNVLIGALNPAYIEVKLICDIRPSSIHRAFHGDWATPNTAQVRPGLLSVYGWDSETTARKYVRVVMGGWEQAVADPEIEAVIIALPLHLHAPCAIAAMQAGKHVLCEKLMAHNIVQCKLMARFADDARRFLSIGHQRHYSLLYDNAVNLIRWGLLGEIHHIRAQWHRGNKPGNDTWAPPLPGGEYVSGSQRRVDKISEQLAKFESEFRDLKSSPATKSLLAKQIAQWRAWHEDRQVLAQQHGYLDDTTVYPDGRVRTALEELVRWRLWDRTGGGLMAELGSHQLDAAGIFVSALSREVGRKIHPLTVHAVGGRHLFPGDRDADDHVYCMFEYPGPGYDYRFDVGYHDAVNRYPDPERGVPSYEQDSDKRIVVTYSSINGNGFGGYGEVVMGTKGTLILDREQEVMVYSQQGTSARAGVAVRGSSAVLDTSASGDAAPARAAQGSGPVSRGYREEMEHWAWCIGENDWSNQPRCNGSQALGDAVIALTARLAVKNNLRPGGHGFIAFQPEWFDYRDDAVPEASSPSDVQRLFAAEREHLRLD